MLKNIVEKKGLVYSIESLNGSRISYREPWRITSVGAKPLFIDEAASVGIARVRRWYNKIDKIAATSTIHGYEGSGRALVKTIRQYFHKTMSIELRDPVRYYPGDPLEEFLYKVFHLDVEPKETSIPGKVYYRRIDVKDLVNYELLRNVYGLLVLAHYRNEPDDLVMMLDSGFLEHRVLTGDKGDVIAVAQLRLEKISSINELYDVFRGRLKGVSVLDKIARYGLVEDVVGKSLWRIVRIVVHRSPPTVFLGFRRSVHHGFGCTPSHPLLHTNIHFSGILLGAGGLGDTPIHCVIIILCSQFYKFLQSIFNIGGCSMSECVKVFTVRTKLVKLGKGRIGFYIPKKHQKELERYLGHETTLTICIHPRGSNG